MSALTDMRDLMSEAESLAQAATRDLVCDAILGSVFGTDAGHGTSLSVFAGERRQIGMLAFAWVSRVPTQLCAT